MLANVQSNTRREGQRVDAAELQFHTREYERLTTELESAYEGCKLPEMPSGRCELNELLVQLRSNAT